MDRDIWASQLALVDLRACIPFYSDLKIRKKLFLGFVGEEINILKYAKLSLACVYQMYISNEWNKLLK